MELRTDEPERRFAPGQVLRQEGGTRLFTVRSVRDHSGRLLVRFAELVDRAGAEAARGTLLALSQWSRMSTRLSRGVLRPAADWPASHHARWRLRSARWDQCCTCRRKMSLEIQTAGGLRLVPFVAALVPDIDLEAGLLTIVRCRRSAR